MAVEKRIVSYCDPLSVEGGDEVRFVVSSLDGEAFDGQLVRLISEDVFPGGSGSKEVECESELNRRYDGNPQPSKQGSSATVQSNAFFEDLVGRRVEVCAYPALNHGVRTLLSCWGDEGGFAIELRDGAVCFIVQGKMVV